VLLALKFLRHCSYSAVDICSILAHASAYFADVYVLCGDLMSPAEVGNVLVTLMFVAHCYVQDETCPLHVWHKYLFKKYCNLRTLNAAVVRLLKMRQYTLGLDVEESTRRFSFLHQAALKHRTQAVQNRSFE